MTNNNPTDDNTMAYKLKIATAFDTLARQSELIDLEARCRTADALEAIHHDLERLTRPDNPDGIQPAQR